MGVVAMRHSLIEGTKNNSPKARKSKENFGENTQRMRTVLFSVSFGARRAKLARRTSRYVERVCDDASRKWPK